jgi:hypothetical protein
MKTFDIKYRGEVHQAIVDDADAEKIRMALAMNQGKAKLSYVPAWKNRGFRPAIWYYGKLCYLSRFLLGLLEPECSHLIVDHIDQNPLNNQRSNLRIVNRRTNALNSISKRAQKTTSKYKGVCWVAQCSRWKAYVYVWVGDKRHTVSKFCKTEDEAYAARLELERQYYTDK